ncbi:MAG: endonuclease [Deltaproteobacteria bacterium]|nr:endonuclease [Deltaproteobacteria bacterium]
MTVSTLLNNIYRVLREHFGYLNWWPAETPFEVVIGTVLTQNVAWSNVEKSILQLKEQGLLDLTRLLTSKPEIVKRCIMPSGYYNVKYHRLMELLTFIKNELKGDILNLKKFDLLTARNKLLSIRGVGKETADSILLYALDFPIFVVDAYTKRTFYRVGILKRRDMDYDKVQEIFMKNLKRDVKLYNDYHAQIVELSKNYCKKVPICESCPIKRLCRRIID